MAWQSSGTTNTDLINQLWRHGLITQEKVKDAFLKVDRAHYAPTAPYQDSPQSIGYAATISAPHMHAAAIEKLLPFILPSSSEDAREAAPRVLDIGSGSGYLTHVMAELVGSRGTVVGVEHIPQLQEMGIANMRKSAQGREFLESGRVKFRVGDGRKGWVEPDEDLRDVEIPEVERKGKGWDAIHVGASAVTLHQELVDQLRAPGRMFIPVDDEEDAMFGNGGGQHVWAVDKDAEGKVTKKKLFAVRYVPLTDGPEH